MKINTLKKELEQKCETNTYLQSTGELWRKDCARLKRELKIALVHAEGATTAL